MLPWKIKRIKAAEGGGGKSAGSADFGISHAFG
jgi:hypothetical protein